MINPHEIRSAFGWLIYDVPLSWNDWRKIGRLSPRERRAWWIFQVVSSIVWSFSQKSRPPNIRWFSPIWDTQYAKSLLPGCLNRGFAEFHCGVLRKACETILFNQKFSWLAVQCWLICPIFFLPYPDIPQLWIPRKKAQLKVREIQISISIFASERLLNDETSVFSINHDFVFGIFLRRTRRRKKTPMLKQNGWNPAHQTMGKFLLFTTTFRPLHPNRLYWQRSRTLRGRLLRGAIHTSRL